MDRHFSHYAPWGSSSCFIFGQPGAGGGFALCDVHSPDDSIFLGWWRPGSPLQLLPFLNGERQRLIEDRTDRGATDLALVPASEITRTASWATETYATPELKLTFHTPFGPVSDPAGLKHADLRRQLCPAIIAELTLDNTGSDQPLQAVFGMQGVNRTLSPWVNTLKGLARGGRWGFAVDSQSPSISEHQTWELPESLVTRATGKDGFHRLGGEGGLVFRVEPRSQGTFRIALATWQEEVVTSGIEAHLYYTSCFSDLADVLKFALENAERLIGIALERNAELAASGLNAQRQFLLGHATRSYLANTELLLSRSGETIFLVGEGEYRMMNTLDLTVDQAFWELKYHPWTVKNELETALQISGYRDRYGLCFSHDIGVAQVFSPLGTSSYEVSEIAGCFSYMTFEELLNWVLTAGLYVASTGDHGWLARHASLVEDLWSSFTARDSDGDGLMDLDSDRCGHGAEITTYDSLDTSLGQARNNLYVGVKTWAAALTFGRLFGQLGLARRADEAEAWAQKTARTIEGHFDEANQYIPAVFEGGNTSRIIPAVEALIYPWLQGDQDAVALQGRYGSFIAVLKLHLHTVLTSGVCLDAKSGGWKLSSTSNNTWMSKIFLNQFVTRTILGMRFPLEETWDEVHAGWMRGGCADFAATDQVDSATGRDLGSRLYPRLVTAVLWLDDDESAYTGWSERPTANRLKA